MSAAVMLSDVADLVMGQSPPSTCYNDVGDGLPFYQGKTDFGATYPTPRIYCSDPKKLAEEGDILMSVRAPVGATNLCKSQSCIGRGIAAIRANGIDRDFLYFYLKKAIARVNRPYENEAQDMVKPHGFVLDFVGIFDKLEKALAFDSDEINAIVKDLKLLKLLFKNKMEVFNRRADFPVRLGGEDAGWKTRAPFTFNDKDVDALIEHFRDPERRKEFFKEYKEIEMLYEIISPDAFLRPFIEDYTTLAAIFEVVRKAYTKGVQIDREFLRKTSQLVQNHIGVALEPPGTEYIAIDRSTLETIKNRVEGKATKVINLIKSIEKTAEKNSDDPFLVAMAERARAVQENFESRQSTTEEALADLLNEIERNEARKKEQAERGIVDSMRWREWHYES